MPFSSRYSPSPEAFRQRGAGRLVSRASESIQNVGRGDVHSDHAVALAADICSGQACQFAGEVQVLSVPAR